MKNKLDTVSQANDAEPNDTRLQAAILVINNTQTGHVGYYYNGARDTTDWYQLTTGNDGRLDVTLTPANGGGTQLFLYDNNGTTLLNSKDSTSAFTVSTDGLAKGTYYLKITSSHSSGFSAYTLRDSLIVPVQANDAEPDNTKNQALSLFINSKKTGHVGYYYNNKRDTADWYKITTKVDTKLKLKLALTNGKPVTVALYAGNGTSLINSFTSGSSFLLTTDAMKMINII